MYLNKHTAKWTVYNTLAVLIQSVMKNYVGNIYQCEFCGKKSAWKHVISNHEKICNKNPKNNHKCLQYCKHLQMDIDEYNSKKYFTCGISGEEMYSFKLERQQNRNSDRILKLRRMPLNCENYECSGGVSGDYVFNR